MFTSDFIKSLSEDEHSLLYLIVYNAIVRLCNFEPDISYVKMLKKDPAIKQLEKLKKKANEESISTIDNLIVKIKEYNG
jgi:hypothetical protein